jgi:putative transposase
MDGKGRWMDNVFIERLWRSVKYERIYLFEHSSLPGLRGSLESWFDLYNNWRPHEKLGNLTPAVVYQALPSTPKAA